MRPAEWSIVPWGIAVPPDRSLETTGWRRGIAKSVIPANAERPSNSTPSLNLSKSLIKDRKQLLVHRFPVGVYPGHRNDINVIIVYL